MSNDYDGAVEITSGKSLALKTTHEGGVMSSEFEIKKRIAKTASGLNLMEIMRLPRHERRRIAKMNGVKKILGSTKPIVNKKKV